jgi:FkbM family methyltransferase
MPFHAEYGQDRWLAEGPFRGKRDGVFVEFGALDGIRDSNSLYFEEECGWRGLLLEGNSALAEPLKRNRPLAQTRAAVIAGAAGWATFAVVDNCIGWSGLARSFEPEHRARIAARHPLVRGIPVPCITLAQALGEAGQRQVDYLSADVEGAECEIFSVFPFGEFDIDVIGVEDNYGRPALAAIFERAGYQKIGRIGPDDFYRRPGS